MQHRRSVPKIETNEIEFGYIQSQNGDSIRYQFIVILEKG